MASRTPSAALRARLRERITDRIAALGLMDSTAADQLGLTRQQMSRLRADVDAFSFDRLADAAEGLGLKVHVSVSRPYKRR